MTRFILVLVLTCLVFIQGNPVKDGEDVGEVLEIYGKEVVVGQTKYPYMAYVKIKQINEGYNDVFHCSGVIIGKATVLTAAHCFRGLNPRNLKVRVQAGVVDVKLEKKNGQWKQMENFIAHEQFRNECKIGKRCCTGVNDIAIIWLQEEFVFGPKVQRAVLNLKVQKPENKDGWILGWGKNAKNSHMLQRGLVKVLPQQECEKFSQYWYIPNTFMCLKSQVGLDIGSDEGDSGGPFVISGIVYGICSQTLDSDTCQRTIDVYTDIARYDNWIRSKLLEGPPKHRNRPRTKNVYKSFVPQ